MHRSILGRLLPLRAADSGERLQELYVHLDGNGAEALQGGRLPATCLVGQLPSCNRETPRSRMDAEGGVKIVRESIGRSEEVVGDAAGGQKRYVDSNREVAKYVRGNALISRIYKDHLLISLVS